MNRFYSDESVMLYHGDMRDVVPLLERKAACIICDPPYGETNLAWDRRSSGWLGLCRDALLPTGSLWLFCSLRALLWWGEMGELAGWRVFQEVVWEKHNGSNFHADRFRRVHELVVQLYRDDVTWGDVYKHPVYTNDAQRRRIHRKQRPAHLGGINDGHFAVEEGGPRLMRSVIYARSEHGRAVHPTQKPLEILMPLLEYSCPPGGLVLDPMAGAGSTLLATKLLGAERTAVGIELEQGYCDAATRRLAQPRLSLGV